jgi:hypothetical protein
VNPVHVSLLPGERIRVFVRLHANRKHIGKSCFFGTRNDTMKNLGTSLNYWALRDRLTIAKQEPTFGGKLLIGNDC